MSRKYVPSFLKNEGNLPSINTSNTNKFQPLSEDYTGKELINTSKPALEAPKLVPATLASITSNGNKETGIKKTYASKYNNYDTKNGNKSETLPVPAKVVNINSADDFPSLGAPKNNIIQETPKITSSFAEKAKEWAKKKELEEEEAKKKAALEEKRLRDAQFVKRMICITKPREDKYIIPGEDETDEQVDDNSFSEEDEYEVPECDEETEEELSEEDSDELNLNNGWDRRRKDDLY